VVVVGGGVGLGGSEGDNQNFKKYKVFYLVDFLAIRCFRRLMFLGKK
jgi:hypothetical protein